MDHPPELVDEVMNYCSNHVAYCCLYSSRFFDLVRDRCKQRFYSHRISLYEKLIDLIDVGPLDAMIKWIQLGTAIKSINIKKCDKIALWERYSVKMDNQLFKHCKTVYSAVRYVRDSENALFTWAKESNDADSLRKYENLKNQFMEMFRYQDLYT